MMTEPKSTPTVGRWDSCGHFWHCGGATQSADGCPCYWSHAAHIDHCENCGLVCPPLPATPAPRVEVIAGADGAYEAFRERVRWFYRNAPECQEARKHSFGRQADVAFTLAMNEALAALRAAPAVDGEPLGFAVWERGRDEPHRLVWVDWQGVEAARVTAQREADDMGYALVPLYAHPAPDVDIRTVLLRFIDTAGNKRDLVTPDQTCALLDLLNELHPEDRPDAE